MPPFHKEPHLRAIFLTLLAGLLFGLGLGTSMGPQYRHWPGPPLWYAVAAMLAYALVVTVLAARQEARVRLLVGAILAWIIGSLLYSAAWYQVQLWLASAHGGSRPPWPWGPLGWLLLVGLATCLVATGLGTGVARLRRSRVG